MKRVMTVCRLYASGYSRRNVFYMREFYLMYSDLPKVQLLVAQIGWPHNLIILQRCKDPLDKKRKLIGV